MNGTVYDAQTGEPLPGAHVAHLNADGVPIGGAATDADGAYVYDYAGAGPIMVRVSFVGYEPIRALVDPRNRIDFELAPVVYDLGEGAEVFGDGPGGAASWGLVGLGVLFLLAMASDD